MSLELYLEEQVLAFEACQQGIGFLLREIPV
jgi:hypothetical protein